MRKNEWTRLEEFTSQYNGEWAPSEGHWLGLDFSYRGTEYRFQTGSMYQDTNTILPDGREAMFGIYRREHQKNRYVLLEEYATMEDVLKGSAIGDKPFQEVILDPDTELLGQD